MDKKKIEQKNEKEPLSPFSVRLLKALKDTNIKTAAALAREMRISKTAVNRWCKSEAEPSREKLVSAAYALGVTLEWLASGEGSMFEYEPSRKKKTDFSNRLTTMISRYSSQMGMGVGEFESVVKIISERACMPKGRIDALLYNGVNPTIYEIEVLAKALGIESKWLAFEEGFAIETSNKIQKSKAIELPPENTNDNLVHLPRYKIMAAAGDPETVLVESHQIVDYMAFDRDWVRNVLRVDEKYICLIEAVGDSMEPNILSGDLLIVNHSINHADGSGIFVLGVGDGIMVKRVQLSPSGSLKIMSDNPIYDTDIIPKNEAEEIRIIGRVLWHCHPYKNFKL